MDIDSWIDRLTVDVLAALLVGIVAVAAWLALLARAHARARLLVGLAKECRRRRLAQEEIRRRVGFAPQLARYERLELDVLKRLEREGLRVR